MASPDKTTKPGSWIFVDDDEGVVVRVALTGQKVRIGRDHSNDIWLDHPGCATHALVFYQRDKVDHIKVYDGAKVFLNGVTVTGMHRLYSGDSVRVADRKFCYARDDSPPEVCLGVTLFDGDEAARAFVLRQTRVVVGRRAGDITIDDAVVADDHLHLEFYADDLLFAIPGTAGRPVSLGDTIVSGRVRLKDGDVLQLGRLYLRVALLPSLADGLMKPLVSKRIAAATDHLKMQAGLHESGPSVRSDWTPPPQDVVAPTVIGALPGSRPSGQLPQWLSDLKDDRPAQPPRPLAAQHSPRPASTRMAAASGPQTGVARSVPRPRPSSRAQAPSVRVAPEVFQGQRVHHDSLGIRTHDLDGPTVNHSTEAQQSPRAASAQRPGGSQRTFLAPDNLPTIAAPMPSADGLHNQHTDVLQIADVRKAVANHHRRQSEGASRQDSDRHAPLPRAGGRPARSAPSRSRPARSTPSQPLPAVPAPARPAAHSVSERRAAHDSAMGVHQQLTQHQPSPLGQRGAHAGSHDTRRPLHASSPYVEAANRTGTELPQSPYSASPLEGGLYRPSRDAGRRPEWNVPKAANPQLTNVMDVSPDKATLASSQAELKHAQQRRRVADARARRTGGGSSGTQAATGFGFSHHDPNYAFDPEETQKPAQRGPVDDSPRRHRIREVDNSPRYYDEKE